MTKYSYQYIPPALRFLGSRVVKTSMSPTGLAVVMEASDDVLDDERQASGQAKLVFRDWLAVDQHLLYKEDWRLLTESELIQKMLVRHQAGEYVALYEQAKAAGRYEILSYKHEEEEDVSKLYY